jgi:dihydrofolate reductase
VTGEERRGKGKTPGPRVSLVVAMDRNRVIGHRGKIPWHLSDDLKRFKALTMGHHIIMGRKTWESIGRALPGRTSVVITRDPAYRAAGATAVASLAQALALAQDDSEAFVIGGAQIYRAALPLARRIYLTQLQAEYPGDTFFPLLEPHEWHESAREHHAAQGAQPAWDFVICERRVTPPQNQA